VVTKAEAKAKASQKEPLKRHFIPVTALTPRDLE